MDAGLRLPETRKNPIDTALSILQRKGMDNLVLLAYKNSILTTGDSSGLKGLLLTVLFAIIILAIVAGLIWCIERWFAPIPAPGKTVIAVILAICVLLWAISNFL